MCLGSVTGLRRFINHLLVYLLYRYHPNIPGLDITGCQISHLLLLVAHTAADLILIVGYVPRGQDGGEFFAVSAGSVPTADSVSCAAFVGSSADVFWA